MPFLCQVLCICVISKKHGLVKRGKEEGAEPEEDTQEHQDLGDPRTSHCKWGGSVMHCRATLFAVKASYPKLFYQDFTAKNIQIQLGLMDTEVSMMVYHQNNCPALWTTSGMLHRRRFNRWHFFLWHPAKLQRFLQTSVLLSINPSHRQWQPVSQRIDSPPSASNEWRIMCESAVFPCINSAKDCTRSPELRHKWSPLYFKTKWREMQSTVIAKI